jgi:O-antigen ligase/tetratricopeptide (TPR) repeat protein
MPTSMTPADGTTPASTARPLIDRVLVIAMAALAFALPLFIWPWSSEYGYTKTILNILWVAAMTITAGIAAWRHGAWRIRIPWVFVPVAALVAFSLLSIVPAINGRVVVQSVTHLVAFGAIALLVVNRVTTKRDVTWILGALLAAGVLASLYGLLQYLGVMAGGPGSGPLGKIISTMGNRNYLGGFLAYLLFPSVILVIRLRSTALRALTLLAIAFCFGTVMLVEQTGIVIGLAAAFVLLLIGWGLFRPIAPLRERRYWLLGLILLLVITFLIEAPSGPLNSVVGLSAAPGSWMATLMGSSAARVRAQDWWVGWEMFSSHPLLGVGLGHYKLQFLPYKAEFLASPQGVAYRDQSIARAAQAHSEYVQVAAELGILGILSVIALLVTLVLAFWRRLRRAADEHDRFDLLLLGAGVATFLIHALVSFPAHLPSSTLVLVLVTGLALSRSYGSSASFAVVLRGWALRGMVVAVTIIGLTASVFAARDFVADRALVRAQRHLQRGETEPAKAELERSIACDFAPRQAYFYLGVLELSQGNAEAAEASFRKCLTRFLSEEVYLYLARVTSSQQDWEEARAFIDQLLATYPKGDTLSEIRYLDGVVAFYETDTRRSLEVLEQLVEEDPRYVQTYVALYRFNALVQRNEEARRYLERGISEIARQATNILERMPTEDTTLRLRSDEYAELAQRIQSLISILNQITTYEDRSELAFISLGELYRAGAALNIFSGFSSAIASYERALAIITDKLSSVNARLAEPLEEGERSQLIQQRDFLLQRQQAVETILLQIP